jgi:hypothetical protein
MRERFGAKDPRSWRFRTSVQTAGNTLTTQEPLNNIVRATSELMAAVLAGVQSVHLSAYDEGLSLPTEHSQLLCLRTQQIVGYETGVTRTVDPLGLVLKAGSWYLIGRSDGDERTYRVDRILGLQMLEEEFERPADFDLAAFWAERLRAFEEGLPHVDVTLRVRGEALRQLRAHVEPNAKPLVPADGSGWVELTLPFERLEFAYAELMALGPAVEVLRPAELRERFAATGRELAALYA